MLIQRMLLSIALTLLGALFLGLLACGPAAPQDIEPAFTGVTAFPQADATEEPAEEATEAPTATPRPTVCITVPPENHEACQSFPTKAPERPKLRGPEAVNRVRAAEMEVRKARESSGGRSQRQVVDPTIRMNVYPVSNDDEVVAAITEVLDDADLIYATLPAENNRPPVFFGDFPLSVIIELEAMPEVGHMRAPEVPSHH